MQANSVVREIGRQSLRFLKDEYTGTTNVQFYLADGTPTTPVFRGTLHSQRVEITFEQQQ